MSWRGRKLNINNELWWKMGQAEMHGAQDPWYLAQLKPNSLRIAGDNLRRQGFRVFCPLQEETRRKGGRFQKELRPLFPGYLFIGFGRDAAPWRAVNSTYGVARLVSFGSGFPERVPSRLISSLMTRCDRDDRLLPPEQLPPGSEVRMSAGPFADFVATVEAIAPDQRVWVLMDIMGRSTRVAVETKHMQKV
ncbi:transcription termination/antitermination protein NusG [Actibacterium sp. D379-3]